MSDEMILVPRYELLAWAEEWQYENDPGDGTDCITPFDTYLLKSPVESQPVRAPAEALRCTCPSGDGSLRWPCPAHPPEAQPVYVGVDLEGGWIRATAPPSAPVGVEEISEDDIAKIAWQAGFHLEKEDAEGEPTDDWQWPNSEGENMFPDLVKFSRKIAALAQQPAAPTWIGIDWAEGHTHPHEMSSGCHCVQCRPHERPCGCNGCRSLAGQPAAVDDAMVERATMALLGKTHDSAPGVDWRCDRSWTVNRVRELMRLALSAALAGQQGGA